MNREEGQETATDMEHGLIIDCFCGGGGASTGIEQALRRPIDIGVNHDPEALRLHAANHPQTLHLEEDIFQVDLKKYVDGRPVDFMWASPDCTHFSKAKGTKPLSKHIRSLPWAVYQHAKAINPSVVMMENVEEITTWGDLDKNGRPVEKEKGKEYQKFMNAMKSLGYDSKTFILNAADYGAPTTRTRWYAVFRKDGKGIMCPEPTHAKDPDLFGHARWKSCGDYIDWDDLGTSIFERAKPLAEKTCRRIARGIYKFVINAKSPYIARHDDGTLVAAYIDKAYGGNYQGCGSSCSQPLHTITAVDHSRLVSAFLIQYHSEMGSDVRGQSLDEPVRTIDTSNRYGLCTVDLDLTADADAQGHGSRDLVTAFLLKYYGQGTGQRLDAPLGTITTKDRFGLVSVLVDGREFVISDIRLRMLKPEELKLMQGFPASYIIDKDKDGRPISKKDQVAKIGNSVCPEVAKALVEANCGYMMA